VLVADDNYPDLGSEESEVVLLPVSQRDEVNTRDLDPEGGSEESVSGRLL
jgi:hypothetical protein